MGKSTRFAIERGSGQANRASSPDPEQSQAFIDLARELGCDETGEVLERAFAKMVPPRRAGDTVAQPSPEAGSPPADGKRGSPRGTAR